MRDDSSQRGRVETTEVEGTPHIRLFGECDLALAAEVQQHLSRVLHRRQGRLVFDLQRVTFLDSSILRLFLEARRELAPYAGEVVLLCRPGAVWRLLSLLEMDRVVRVCSPDEWLRCRPVIN